jgi:hypothetical protein
MLPPGYVHDGMQGKLFCAKMADPKLRRMAICLVGSILKQVEELNKWKGKEKEQK